MKSDHEKYTMTPQELDGFLENGFAGPFDLYEPEEAKEIWAEVRVEFFDTSHEPYPGCTLQYDRHLDIDRLTDHVTRPEIVYKAAQVLGPDVICWRTEVFSKLPGTEGTDWHQGVTFSDETNRSLLDWPPGNSLNPLGGALTFWTAFSDVSTKDKSPLQFIPGTFARTYFDETKTSKHDPNLVDKVIKRGVKRGFLGYDYSVSQRDPNWNPEAEPSATMLMKAGQFVMFWSTLVHASLPHEAEQPRYASNIRYLPTNVKVYPGMDSLREFGCEFSIENWRGVLVAGKDEYGINKLTDKNRRGTPFRAPISFPS